MTLMDAFHNVKYGTIYWYHVCYLLVYLFSLVCIIFVSLSVIEHN